MINCPICGKCNLVTEKPYCDRDEDDQILIDSYCIDCKTGFTTTHKIDFLLLEQENGNILKLYRLRD